MRTVAVALLLLSLAGASAPADVTPPFSSLHPKLLDEVKQFPLASGDPETLAINPAGTVAAFSTGSGRLFVVDLEADPAAPTEPRQRNIAVSSLAFARGDVLAVGLKSGAVQLRGGPEYKDEDAREFKVTGEAGAPITRVVFSPSGRYLAAVDPKAVSLVDVAAGTVVRRSERGGSPESSVAVTFDRSERRLMFITSEGLMTVIDTAGGSEVTARKKPEGLEAKTLEAVTIDPSGSMLAFRDRDNLSDRRVVVFDLRRGAVPYKTFFDDDGFRGLTYAAEGAYLIGHAPGELRVWNTLNGHIERVLWVMSDTLLHLAVAGDADRIVTIGRRPDAPNRMILRLFGVRSDRAARPGFIGVRTQRHARGALVTRQLEDTAAPRSGIYEDDVITHIDGTRVNDDAHAIELQKARTEGTTVEVTLLRDGKELKVNVTLGPWLE